MGTAIIFQYICYWQKNYKMDNSIQIFITGGTFDKSYNYKDGSLYFEKTHLPEMLKRSRCRLNVSVETLMMLDSLEMNETHIEQIISKCKNSKCNKIIITHGTENSMMLYKHYKKIDSGSYFWDGTLVDF